MKELNEKIKKLSDKSIAEHSKRFFKTEKGEYGYGDKFLGIRVPKLRELSKEYQEISKTDLDKLVSSPYHEKRLLGVLIVVLKFQKEDQTFWYKYYIKNFKYVNNWDLVDTTCHKIVGAYLFDKDKKVLLKWAKSRDLWTRRISMMSTYYFIQRNEFDMTFKVADILIGDKHDLIHKVVGWMIREVSKRDEKRADQFLKLHYKTMPRTMLRYAIEKYPKSKREKILKGSWL